MKILLIQENGRHDANRNYRECFCLQRAFIFHGHECDVWGLGHTNFTNIPEYESYDWIINLENYDCLKQNFDFRCEIVGSHKKNFDTIFNRNLFINNGIYDWHVENVYAYRFSLYKNVLVCPIFDIEPTQRGGLNEIYYQL